MDNNILQPETDNTVNNPQQQLAAIVSALMVGNTARYPRLQARLERLSQAINSPKTMPQEVQNFVEFVTKYKPIDKKMQAFLLQYAQSNAHLLSQLVELVGSPKPTIKDKLQPVLKPKLNVKKYGLYRFPYLMQDKLNVGDVSQFKTINQELNQTGVHFKLWKDINGIPFLVNGFQDDEYSCVTKVLASQVGKLLGLQCEEVLFGNLNGKVVTLTAYHEAVTLLENETFQLYHMASNYDYQSEQKRALYFLIQNWTAYAVINSQVRERFERHYIDSKGNIFLSQHEQAMFLTPEQMSPAMMVRLNITQMNYGPIRDMIRRIGDTDLAEVVFGSIPVDMIEAHDAVADRLNKPTFDQKKESFDANWTRLLEAMQEFEQLTQTRMGI